MAGAQVDLAARYREVRRATEALRQPLTAEDCAIQSMPDMSPVKWHLGHTSWFFETLVLEPLGGGFRPHHPAFRELFNSYYHTVGRPHPRPQRGLLSRPSLEEVLDYRRHVDREMGRRLGDGLPPEREAVATLGLHHEQQHQELILMDVKHLFSCNPLRPAYRPAPPASAAEAAPLRWHGFPGGVRRIGHQGDGFAFDNEGPRHEVVLHDFELASRTVTNAEYRQFIEEGGYRRPDLWLSDGWDAVQAGGWEAPLYWEHREDGWGEFTLGGMQLLQPLLPVCHVSFYEADAFARWAGARLPTEAEWEAAAAEANTDAVFAEDGLFHPTPPSPSEGDGRPTRMLGNVWEWTGSPYIPYPGFRPPAGPLGEYNGKFMCNQMVMRGGSCATPRSHIRTTYRNFFYPHMRWQFGGIRLARGMTG